MCVRRGRNFWEDRYLRSLIIYCYKRAIDIAIPLKEKSFKFCMLGDTKKGSRNSGWKRINYMVDYH